MYYTSHIPFANIYNKFKHTTFTFLRLKKYFFKIKFGTSHARLLRWLLDRLPLPEKEIVRVILNRFCFLLFSDFLPAKPDRRNLTAAHCHTISLQVQYVDICLNVLAFPHIHEELFLLRFVIIYYLIQIVSHLMRLDDF